MILIKWFSINIVCIIVLYRAYNPVEGKKIQQLEPTNKEERKSSNSSTTRGNSGGSSRRGGSSFDSEATVSSKEFQSHATIENCWVLIDGIVFDITGFIMAYSSIQEESSQYCGAFGFEEGFLKNNQEYKDAVSKASIKKGVIR